MYIRSSPDSSAPPLPSCTGLPRPWPCDPRVGDGPLSGTASRTLWWAPHYSQISCHGLEQRQSQSTSSLHQLHTAVVVLCCSLRAWMHECNLHTSPLNTCCQRVLACTWHAVSRLKSNKRGWKSYSGRIRAALIQRSSGFVAKYMFEFLSVTFRTCGTHPDLKCDFIYYTYKPNFGRNARRKNSLRQRKLGGHATLSQSRDNVTPNRISRCGEQR